MKVNGLIAKRLLGRLTSGAGGRENDLLSYLLFDGEYCSQLIDLGRSDAAKKSEELAALFDPVQVPPDEPIEA